MMNLAMMKGINYSLTPNQIESILYETASNIGSSYYYGHGLLNTGYAVQMAKYKGLRAENIKIKSYTSPSKNTVKLKWNELYKGEGYCISRATSKNGDYKRVGISDYENFTDKNLKSGKTYYYKVRAYMNYQSGSGTVNGNVVGYSTYSDIVKVKVK